MFDGMVDGMEDSKEHAYRQNNLKPLSDKDLRGLYPRDRQYKHFIGRGLYIYWYAQMVLNIGVLITDLQINVLLCH